MHGKTFTKWIHCLPDELERQILQRFQAALSK